MFYSFIFYSYKGHLRCPLNSTFRPSRLQQLKIGQNTEKSSGDLRNLAVTETPVKNHQLTLL